MKKITFDNDKAIILWLKFAYLLVGYKTRNDNRVLFDKYNINQEDLWTPIFQNQNIIII